MTRRVQIYGAPMCDDPRDFTPDDQCCTPAEIAAWRDAVRRADNGEIVSVPHHVTVRNDDGEVLMHLANQPWGIGISWIEEDEEGGE